MITVDGATYNLPCSVSRTGALEASDISGLLLDRTYFADIIGTYLSYAVKLAIPVGQEAEYATLYEVLTDPVGYHEFTLPYNQDTVKLSGRVEDVVDDFYREEKRGDQRVKVWRKIQFTIQASTPTKVQTLEEAVAYGTPKYPEIAEPLAGEMYRYTTGGTWEAVSFEDVDEVAY